jgi:putative sigma-54 modulation protein
MNIEINAKDMKVSDRLQEYVEKKLGRLERYLPNIAHVRVDLTHEHSRRMGEHPVAQLTIRNERGTILRAEVKDQPDMHTAIDVVVDRMYRLISRYKGKQRRRAGERFAEIDPELAAAELPPIELTEEDVDQGTIVRRKTINLIPMNEQEAVDQMELLGHAFFVFYNADTAQVNVVYRRESGDYGILEPKLG